MPGDYLTPSALVNSFTIGAGGMPVPPAPELLWGPDESLVQAAIDQIRASQIGYQKLKNYYDGRHALAFATDKYRNAFGRLLRPFSDNICPGIVDAVKDRMQVTGFDVGHMDQTIPQALDEIWANNFMGLRSKEVHSECLKTGDAYVIIWPDADGFPCIYPNESLLMTVGYNDEVPGQIDWAAKAWVSNAGKVRLTIYTPTAIVKYMTREAREGQMPDQLAAFDPYVIDGEPWPLPNPYGQVPVFHFANNAGMGKMGWSEMSNVIPIQDGLNKSVLDMLVAMEFAALPQRWATGLEMDVDEDTGHPREPFTPGVERLWAVASEMTKFGQFNAADLQQFLNVSDAFRMEAARVTGTPLTYMMLTQTPPSGDALDSLLERFLKKVEDRNESYGVIWGQAMGFALRVLNGVWDPKGAVKISTQWKDVAPMTQQDQAQLQQKKQAVGVDRLQSLQEMGYTLEKAMDMLHSPYQTLPVRAKGSPVAGTNAEGGTSDTTNYGGDGFQDALDFLRMNVSNAINGRAVDM